MDGLIILKPLGTIKERSFRRLIVETGDVPIKQATYPRLQMITVPDILEGKRLDTLGAVGSGLKQPQLRF